MLSSMPCAIRPVCEADHRWIVRMVCLHPQRNLLHARCPTTSPGQGACAVLATRCGRMLMLRDHSITLYFALTVLHPLSVVVLQDAHDDIALPLSVDKHAVMLKSFADKATFLVDGDSSAVAGKDA